MRLSAATMRSRTASALFGLSCVLAALCPAHAQILYYDAEGAVIASDVSGNDILIGSVNADPFTVTVANGAVTNFNNDFTDGVFGVDVRNQAQIAMTGGSVNYLQLRDSSGLSQSGGYLTNLSAGANATVNLSGSANLESLNALEQTRVQVTGGFLQYSSLYGDSQLRQSGGQIQRMGVNGSASVTITGGGVNDILAQDSSRVAISGGGGGVNWLALDAAQFDIQGSELSVAAGEIQRIYDFGSVELGGLFTGRTGTLTGKLADGNRLISQSLFFGEATGDSAHITLTGAERAPDLYLDTDQTISGVYSNVVIAMNLNTGISPNVTLDALTVGRVTLTEDSVAQVNGGKFYNDLRVNDNALARVSEGELARVVGYGGGAAEISGGSIGEVNLYGNSAASLSGGTVTTLRGAENSMMNVSGTGTIQYGYLFQDAVLNVSGGAVRSLTPYQNAAINVSGGSIDAPIALREQVQLTWSGGTVNVSSVLESAQLTILGSGLSTASDGPNILWNGADLYSGAYHNVSGTLTDGTALNNDGQIFAGSVSGDDTQITFTGAERAPDLYQTADGTISGFHSVVYVGRNADSTTQTSPTVTVDSAAHFGRLDALNGSHVAFNGGKTEGFIVAFDRSSVDVTGGQIADIQTFGTSTAIITGGSLGVGYFQGNSAVGIGGGTIPLLSVFENGTVNITGGRLGLGPDGGLYFLSGALNLFGTDIALANGEETFYGPSHGIRYELTGSLLSGDALNTHLFIADGATLLTNPGTSQESPYLPGAAVDGVFTFSAVPSGLWFDPPLVSAYDFAMIDGGRFTDILGFPSGFSGAFGVEVGGILLGSFAAGQSLNFADFGYVGGVPTFRITGISPPPDAEDQRGFPLRLAFNTAFGSFTMQGVGATAAPEPSSFALFALALILAALTLRQRKAVD